MSIPLSVLFIEDSESDSALLIRQLERAGYTVTHLRVETSEQLRTALHKQTWDVIIADYHLPEFDAPDALNLLQETGLDIPFIVISGAVGEETAVALMRSGARDYLMKSNLTRLGPVIRRELSEAQIRRERKQAEDLLHLQSTALNAAANAILITNLDGTIEWVNQAFTDLTGYLPSEAIGRNPRDLVNSGQQSRAFYKNLWDTILAGNVWHGEIINRHKDGRFYSEELTITPLRNHAGQITQFIAIKQDVTPRKQAEEKLRASEDRYRVLFEYSPIAIWEEDFSEAMVEIRKLLREEINDLRAYLGQHPEAVRTMAEMVRIRDINQNGSALFALPAREDLRLPLAFYQAEAQPAFCDMLTALYEGKTSFQCEIPYRTVNGEEKVLVMNIVVAPGYEATCSKVLTSFIDITEQRRAEVEMSRQNQALETIRNVLSGITVQLDINSILERAVNGALELTGLESGMLFLEDVSRRLILTASKNVPDDLLDALSQKPFGIEECLHNRTLEDRPVIVWDAAAEKSQSFLQNIAGVRFHAVLPLIIKGRTIGVLCVFARDDRKPFQHNIDLLFDLCGSFALAVENAQLYQKTQRDAARAESLARMASRLTTSLNLESVLHTVCEEAAHALNIHAANVMLYDQQTGLLKVAADRGFPPAYRERLVPIELEVYQQIRGLLGPHSQIVNLQDHANIPGVEIVRENRLQSVLSVQMTREDHLVGILNVFTRNEQRHFSADDFALLQGLADQAAQAIDNARLFEQVSAGRKRLRALSQKLVEVQEAERRTLALELHDELGQVLNSVKMSLNMIPQLPPESANEQLIRAQDLVGDLVVRVRRLSLELRPSMLDDMGLLSAFRWLFKNYKAQTGVSVTFEHSNIDQRFAPQVEITAYRITQEALTNVMRHAGNKRVLVEAWADEQAFHLQIRDHGKGFDLREVTRKSESSGLSGMRERARLIGGELAIETEHGVGTTLTVQLPFQWSM